MTATNAVGSGPASAASAAVTPATVPGAPTAVTATRGNGQVTVGFTAPASDGGSAITSYTATSNPGNFTGNCTAPCASITVSGLTNGTAYTFTVTATNAVGSGPASAASAAVTPATVPGAPTAVTATRGNGQVTVGFTAPASDGGSAITSYTATSNPGNFTGNCTAPCASITVMGLANGTAYTFTVTATNAVGSGPASAASAAVTPATVPGAPTAVTATRGNGQVTVGFAAPASDGGSAITQYTATSNPGNFTGSCTAPCTSITVSGLTNGTAYTFTVTATNAVGTGPASAASAAVTPATVPGRRRRPWLPWEMRRRRWASRRRRVMAAVRSRSTRRPRARGT
ncbi:MAG: fibronectin type III domain-containing protein [Betaproteobacteria bacterium]|nr:fibronectin type III domain-containing protein [Betaproteobacteria bacterium]